MNGALDLLRTLRPKIEEILDGHGVDVKLESLGCFGAKKKRPGKGKGKLKANADVNTARGDPADPAKASEGTETSAEKQSEAGSVNANVLYLGPKIEPGGRLQVVSGIYAP